jgi:hypothetical protein
MASGNRNILRISSRPRETVEQIREIISDKSYNSLIEAIDKNVVGLFELGVHHHKFASTEIPSRFWRQKISRFYYSAYNVKRSIQLNFDGLYRTDSSDHKEIGNLPEGLTNRNQYTRQLRVLRDDRNLSDYDHVAQENDLVIGVKDTESLVASFISDARSFLTDRGINL